MQHERQCVPVTALAFFREDLILSGEGTYLCAYNQHFKLCKRIRVFESQAIHGIVVLESRPSSTIAVWGGSFVRIVFLQQEDGDLKIAQVDLLTAHDWILDLAFAASEEPLAALVTAHNALWTLRIHESSRPGDAKQEVLFKQVVAGSNCILYSAHVIWLSSSRCLIASGTAFGDILVWSSVLNVGKPLQCQTHYTFPAHEGSVFGVRLSPRLSVSGLDCQRMLATCSDDRTVKLWDISDLRVQAFFASEVQNNTGFGYEPKAETSAPRCMTKVMGHISRIWHVRFYCAQTADEPLKILSFGEDASVIVWTLAGTYDGHVMSQSRAITPHESKNIWAVAVYDTSGAVLTGGADGAIATQTMNHDGLLTNEIPQSLHDGANNRDNFRSYAFVGTSALLATTDRGRVVLLDCAEAGVAIMTPVIAEPVPGLEGYSSVSSIDEMAFIGGGDGAIHVYTHPNRVLSKLAEVDRKIAGLFVNKALPGQVALLGSSVGSTTANLIAVEGTQAATITRLALPQGFVTTSFVHFSLESVSYAMIGSRRGSLAVYEYREDIATPIPCVKLSTEVHGKDAVTALIWVDAKAHSGSQCHGWLLSIGRDGTFAVHAVLLDECNVELQLVHQLSLPIGPNLEDLLVDEDGNVSALGFRSKHFVTYNVTEQRETMKVECGGAHRNWAFQPYHCGGQFVWTKASQVFHAKQSSLPYQLVNSGGHGREIKALAVSISNVRPLIATGSEDTNIKLFTIQRDGFKCVQTLRRHNTGVQHLQWHQSHLFSSGGFEEFFVWRVTPNIPHIEIGVVCESKHPRTGVSDLRIMGFDVVNAVTDAGLVITMAYSDSTLKVWRYLNRSWWLAATADYLTSCLTQTFRIPSRVGEIFTTATDGHIARWSLSNNGERLEWIERHKVHQNAIHDVAHIEIDEGRTSLVITGGDDNAIGITRIGEGISASTLLVSNTHAAAVTGLAILPVHENTLWLVSGSIDQRVKLWRLDIDVDQSGVDGIELKLLHDDFTAVADVSKLEVCQSEDDARSVLICGVGMDMWRLPTMDMDST